MSNNNDELAKELGRCAGKWVATANNHVVGCGDTVQEALGEARDNSVERPVTFHVPSASSHCYY